MASPHSTANLHSQPPPPQHNEVAQDHTMTDANADAPPPPTTIAAPPTPPYSAPFENALMDLILQPPDSTSSSSSALITAGTQILDDTNPKPEPGFKGPSLHVRDIDPLSLPHVEAGELPLGLEDPRRRFRTQVVGVRVTHPGGSFGGGIGAYGVHPLFPGSDGEGSGAGAGAGVGVGVGIGSGGGGADAAALLADTRAFIAEKDVKTGLGLRRAIRAEQQVLLRRVRERMERRREAVEGNERVEREVKKLEDQRGMERRLEQRVRERRAGRKGG
ncbi:hypothetical protein LTS18_003353 [Coniosporium uncinatum]|uniref:Uncharacterized protein n=1 Tax=Coniosporium uncinatum TaxID=93489 RepID=A0ACC3DTN4_9PEZI|nr:hypothetical protein LTS18_003353 [Coniosporium uncinatum]